LGYGTALLRHGLSVCDRETLPVYLESTNAANLSLYERHGFEVLAEVQVDGSPMRYPMLRAPR
jgi:ribosomal protein S18 acetylase RimI-like enzyme